MPFDQVSQLSTNNDISTSTTTAIINTTSTTIAADIGTDITNINNKNSERKGNNKYQFGNFFNSVSSGNNDNITINEQKPRSITNNSTELGDYKGEEGEEEGHKEKYSEDEEEASYSHIDTQLYNRRSRVSVTGDSLESQSLKNLKDQIEEESEEESEESEEEEEEEEQEHPAEENKMSENDQFVNQLQSLISSDQKFGAQLLKLLISNDPKEDLKEKLSNIGPASAKNDSNTGNVSTNIKPTVIGSNNINKLPNDQVPSQKHKPISLNNIEKSERKKKKKSSKRSDLLKEMLKDRKSPKTNSVTSDANSLAKNPLKSRSLPPSPYIQKPSYAQGSLRKNIAATIVSQSLINNQNKGMENSFIPSARNHKDNSTADHGTNFDIISNSNNINNNTLRNNSSTGSSLKKVKLGPSVSNDSSVSPPAIQDYASYNNKTYDLFSKAHNYKSPYQSSTNRPEKHSQLMNNNNNNFNTKKNYSSFNAFAEQNTNNHSNSVPIYKKNAGRSLFDNTTSLVNMSSTDIKPKTLPSEKDQKQIISTELTEEELLKIRRKRNVEASARFRLRKKLKYQENLQKYDALVNEISGLERRIEKLGNENEFWKEKLKHYYDLQNRQYLESIRIGL